ncbi:MAG: iron-containing alcohol dehydrogenase [Armatimonadota bacterium]
MDTTVFSFQWAGKVMFGPGRLQDLGIEAKSLGSRVFLATTRDLTALGLTQRVETLLKSAGCAVVIFDDVEPDPTCVAVDAAAEPAVSSGCDVIVALGGGSAIDFAKGVSVSATHPGPVWDYVNYTGANAKPVNPSTLPVIAVPTTAGTGSEVTNGVVLHNPDTHMKAALLSVYAIPRVALVDPELTYTMPTKVTAMTGFDALTHGMEAYLNAGRCSPFSDMAALETVRLVKDNLPLVLANPDDRSARLGMAWAATLGGMSIVLSGATVAHAMGLPLGARLDVPHGLGLALLLPVVLNYSWSAQPERCAALADVVGASEPRMDAAEKSMALVAWLKDFVRNIGLDDMRSSEGIDDAMLNLLTDDVFAYMYRPVQQHRPVFTREQIRQQFKEALQK